VVQYKIFAGTFEEIEHAFNLWAAGLPNGVNVNTGPLVQIDGAAGRWLKEVLYVLPGRPVNGIAVPQPGPPMDIKRAR
jgi:hypothetical protein